MAFVLALIGLNLLQPATAQDVCPSKVIKIVVPNPAGGVGDILTRIIGERASAELDRSVVIENVPGATTTIGTNVVAKSKPDGCTILSLTTSGVVATLLMEKLPYDLWRDFSPIVNVGSFPMVLAVAANSKINSMSDLIAAARSKEGLTYGSGGNGTMAHLSAARLVKDVAGTGNHIPYRGNSPAIQALLGNQIQLFFPSTAEAIPLVKGGKIRLLGVTSEERFPNLPDTPSMKELGFPEFNPRLWFAFLAPVNTHAEVIAKLQNAIAKSLVDPSVQTRLNTLGFSAEVKNPAGLAAYMKSEASRWGKVIVENNIKGDD
jgi:tripartite-type tricarboxylate transporter receptor subunit TctC